MPGSSQTASDLGRLVIEQRHRAGLSRAETAERAGMAPSYLEYLETSSAPEPGAGALARLAAALGTTISALTGAGMNLPPGQRQAARRPLLEVLSAAERRALLAPGGCGRALSVTPTSGSPPARSRAAASAPSHEDSSPANQEGDPHELS